MGKRCWNSQYWRNTVGNNLYETFNCTKSTKLKNFQLKLLHRQIATKSFLHKVGIKNRNNCTFCEVERETLLYLFWRCRVLKRFSKTLKNWLIKYEILPETKSIDKLTALVLKCEYESPLVSLSTPPAKCHIYVKKNSRKRIRFSKIFTIIKTKRTFRKPDT